MSEIHHVVDEIIPPMYQDIKTDFDMPPTSNLAASNQCHVLSKGLWIALNSRKIESRREYHKTPNEAPWHFMIAHTPIDAEPSDDDLITDLNPWHYMNGRAPINYSYLHAPRGEVMERLRAEGAPEYIVALRGLSTIVRAHTEVAHPSQLK